MADVGGNVVGKPAKNLNHVPIVAVARLTVKRPKTQHGRRWMEGEWDSVGGGQALGTVKVIKSEHLDLAGHHPCQRMDRVDDPFLVGDDRDALKAE
jgi:hypothetical protein